MIGAARHVKAVVEELLDRRPVALAVGTDLEVVAAGDEGRAAPEAETFGLELLDHREAGLGEGAHQAAAHGVVPFALGRAGVQHQPAVLGEQAADAAERGVLRSPRAPEDGVEGRLAGPRETGGNHLGGESPEVRHLVPADGEQAIRSPDPRPLQHRTELCGNVLAAGRSRGSFHSA